MNPPWGAAAFSLSRVKTCRPTDLFIAAARTDYSYAPGSDPNSTWNGRLTDKGTLVEAKAREVYDLQLSYTCILSPGRLRWEIQLNINNLIDQRELIVKSINGRTFQPLTYYYQDPRAIELAGVEAEGVPAGG